MRGWWLWLITNRGVIQNVARAQQINDFRHLLFGKITPTDIDGVIEYQNKAYIIIEDKYGEKELPYGQKLAIERMIDDLSEKKHALAIVCEHEVHDTNNHVDVSDCNVREIYSGNIGEREWRKPRVNLNTKQAVENFLLFVNKHRYKPVSKEV